VILPKVQVRELHHLHTQACVGNSDPTFTSACCMRSGRANQTVSLYKASACSLGMLMMGGTVSAAVMCVAAVK
jgi:hypothetical protein